jgi:hypothetical protein
MLVCGCINPPPVCDPDYEGVYFSLKDDMPSQAATMKGTPLLVEHSSKQVGSILSAWTANNGSMYALAEIDDKSPGGAVAAEYVRRGGLGEFSMGYTQTMMKCQNTGRFKPVKKSIREVSLVKQGARPGCLIAQIEK